MDLEVIKKGFDIFKKENKIRQDLLKDIITNNKEGIERNQRRYSKLYELVNNEIYTLINKMSYIEIKTYLNKMIDDPRYVDLTGFFILLLSYHMLAYKRNDAAKKLNEDRDLTYYNLVKWYSLNHAISKNQLDNLADEIGKTTVGSIGIRNILANREELNTIFDDIKLHNELERAAYIEFFVKETNLFIQLLTPMALAAATPFGELIEIPKTIILRLVLANILAKKYSMGFSIEEYVNRYLDNHNVIAEAIGETNLPLRNDIIKPIIDDYLMEINDITNEFLNQKKK